MGFSIRHVRVTVDAPSVEVVFSDEDRRPIAKGTYEGFCETFDGDETKSISEFSIDFFRSGLRLVFSEDNLRKVGSIEILEEVPATRQ